MWYWRCRFSVAMLCSFMPLPNCTMTWSDILTEVNYCLLYFKTPFSEVSTFRSSTLKKSACFLRGLMPAYETTFSHTPQMMTATDVRNSDVAEVWCLHFAKVIAVMRGPMWGCQRNISVARYFKYYFVPCCNRSHSSWVGYVYKLFMMGGITVLLNTTGFVITPCTIISPL